MSKVGIAIITYNRQDTVTTCIEAVQKYTKSPYSLIVADDGSTDGTQARLKSLGVEYITGPNAGAGPNKNRALFALMNLTDCDPIILLEDDCIPIIDRWEARWIEAGHRLHHANVALPDWGDWFYRIQSKDADGSPTHPYWWEGFTGQCTVSSRWALEKVGYIDPLFKGFGEEHVEWTRRFGRLLGWKDAPEELVSFPFPRCETPSIIAPELSFPNVGTFHNPEETEGNQQILQLIKNGPIYRPPARSPSEKDALALSIGGLLLRRGVSPITTNGSGANAFTLTLKQE